MFAQKTKSEFVLEFVRTLPKSKKSQASVYLFPPAEVEHFTEVVDHSEWNARPIDLRYRVIGVPEDKKQATEQTVSLLSPHYEALRSTWMLNFQRSLEKIQAQIQQSGLDEQPVNRLILLFRAFAKRIRTNASQEPRQQRYQRQLDVYFSWLAEQNILILMQHEDWNHLDPEVQEEVVKFLQQEMDYRQEQGYQKELSHSPARIYYRMQLYRRFIDRFIQLKAEVAALGDNARRAVKALITTLVMSLFTLFVFYYRDSYSVSIGLIFIVALVYAFRDLLRDDLVKFLTDKYLRNRPSWRLKYRKNRKAHPLFVQFLRRSVVSSDQLPEQVRKNSGKWFLNLGRNVFFFNSAIETQEYSDIEENIEESLEIDFKAFADLISSTKTPVYQYQQDNPEAPISTQLIEQRHYYNLVVLTQDLKNDAEIKVQRWKITITSDGLVNCEAARIIE